MIERKRSLVPVSEPPLTRTDDAAGRDGHTGTRRPDDRERPIRPRRRRAAAAPAQRRLAVFVAIPVVAAARLRRLDPLAHPPGRRRRRRQQQRDFVPEVRTAKAKRLTDPVELTQPGQTVAFETANVFARSTGYVAERLVDIGSRVHKGDLLIRIAAPDLDQQLVQAQAQVGQNEAAVLQAQANLQQAQATVKLADVTKSRTTTLANQGWETKQNADNSTANAATGAAGVSSAQAGIAVALANLRAQQATVQRLQELTGFERVTAPFDGVVTARNVDVGNLLTADNGSGTPMLSMSRDDVLRVAVYVPQSGAVGVQAGLPAKVTIPELPGRSFDAHVSRTAQVAGPGVALDADGGGHRQQGRQLAGRPLCQRVDRDPARQARASWCPTRRWCSTPTGCRPCRSTARTGRTTARSRSTAISARRRSCARAWRATRRWCCRRRRTLPRATR